MFGKIILPLFFILTIPFSISCNKLENIPLELCAEKLTAAAVEANTHFGLDLYKTLKQDDNNIVYSPYSISSLITMTSFGAVGETQEEMDNSLSFTLPNYYMQNGYAGVRRKLSEKTEGYGASLGFNLKTANSIWVQEGFQVLNEFTANALVRHKADIYLTDFINHPYATMNGINNWVSKNSNDKIGDLLNSNDIDSDTRMVLLNTTYLKALWSKPFLLENTYDDIFYGPQNSCQVPTMHQENHFRYMKTKGLAAIELPYQGDFHMLIFLPDESVNSSEFKDLINSEKISQIYDQMSYVKVSLSLPRFDVRESLPLHNILPEMGLVQAFSSKADFSGITGHKDLYINKIVHETYLSVNEVGIEAAAATAAIMNATAIFDIDKPVEFNVNKPFLFMIFDGDSSTLLFMGQVNNPVLT